MRWSFAQIGLLVICAFHVIQAVIGLIVNPSFATGPNAPTVQLLGMDYNGWHAVAGPAVFAPGPAFAVRKSWAVLYLLLAAIAGALPGIWAFFSHRVAYVFTFSQQHHRRGGAFGDRGGDAGGGSGADPHGRWTERIPRRSSESAIAQTVTS